MGSDKLKKIEFKRLLKRYESALEDLEYLKEMSSEINSEFGSALAAKKRQDLFESNELKDMAENQEEDEPESASRDPLFKKLFRKIVVKCHPDRMDAGLSIQQQAEYLELYDLANKANDEDNMALLIVVAIKLEIELGEEYVEHIQRIEEEKEKVESEIENIQGSVAWQWYHADETWRDKILDDYISHMEKMIFGPKKQKVTILGTGHPRTGTGFTAHILQSWGLDVQHEALGKDGIVAWQLAVSEGPWVYLPEFEGIDPKFIIYNVRDPRTAIASIVFTENVKPASTKFRVGRGGVLRSSNRVEFACNSIIRWDQLITAKNPDFTYRVEDQEKELFDFLKSKGLDIEYKPSTGAINARKHEGIEELEHEKSTVRPSIKRRINEYCQKYGYPPFF